MTTIDERDYQIIVLVTMFKQLTTAHINELLFADSKTHMPCLRALHRLMAMRYLRRNEYRIVGGARGGSGQYVYQPWSSKRVSIDHHALSIADAYIELVRLERAGSFKIVSYETEPECYVVIHDYEHHKEYKLEPDFSASLMRADGRTMTAFLEVDRGTEFGPQIKSKLVRYWQAKQVATTDDIEEWPRIYWVALNDDRRDKLASIVKQGKPEQQALFRVITLADMSTVFS